MKAVATLNPITKENKDVFDEMVQAYEHEFAPITKKKPGPDGRYALDSTWKEPNYGFYCMDDGAVSGFCIVGKSKGVWDVLEFYIAPSFRHKGLGKAFAKAVFTHFKGPWQVKQIQGAGEAKAFWRAAIKSYTDSNFKEETFNDPYWGPVTCQSFNSLS